MEQPQKIRKGDVLFVSLAAALLLGLFAAFVLRFYYIKCYSDPLNWLSYAREFRTEFFESKWPFGYPLVLAGLLKAVGPYWIFLTNALFIMLVAVFVGRLASRAGTELDGKRKGLYLGLLAALVFMLIDTGFLVYMCNPYRDPLSFILLLGSALFFISYVTRPDARLWRVACSGLLLGFAYCVRETSVLLALPLFLCGLYYWMRDRSRSFWIPVLVFGVTLVMGALPFMLQGYLHNGSLIKPNISGVEKKLLPGMHLHVFGPTGHKAWIYYVMHLHGYGLALAGLGMLGAVIRRNGLLLSLCLPACLIYSVFYCFYWTFIPRYFLVVNLFLAIFIAYGLYLLVLGLERILKDKATACLPIAASLLIGLFAWQTLSQKTRPGAFRMADAQRFSDTINRQLAPDSFLLIDRNLCEVIRWFTHVSDSYPCMDFVMVNKDRQPDWNDDTLILQKVREMLDTFPQVYCARITQNGKRMNHEDVYVRRYFDLQPAGAFATRDFNLFKAGGDVEVELLQVQPWSLKAVEVEVPEESDGSELLRISARHLWNSAHPDRTYARLILNGVLLDERVEDGANYYHLPTATVAAGPLKLRFESDAPIPADFAPILLDHRLVRKLDVGSTAEPMHRRLLSPGFFERQAHDKILRSLRPGSTIDLPRFWGEDVVVVAELFLRPFCKEKLGLTRVLLDAGMTNAVPHDLAMDRVIRGCNVELPPAAMGATNRIVIRSQATSESVERIKQQPFVEAPYIQRADDLELSRIYLHPVFKSERLHLNIGQHTDAAFLHQGFYSVEHDGRHRLRWCKPDAAFSIYIWPDHPATPYRLILHASDPRPADAPPANPQFEMNGTQLNVTRSDSEDKGWFLLEMDVPAHLLKPGANILHLNIQGWSPADANPDGHDQRQLGLQLDYLRLNPVAPKDPVDVP